LLPYIYSLAGSVTHEGGTILRPLVMDFTSDPRSRQTADQFLFGPAFLVSPVTTYKARSRSVYLPPGTTWFDFWTGTPAAGGQTVETSAPYDSIPVHVRAGSIVPVGPELQYVAEKAADPLTLYVYAGANGAFTLYEDDGLTYGYEKGESSRIPISWDEASRTLVIGKREGSFPGMLKTRRFDIVLVASGKPVGWSFEPTVDRTLTYSGEAMQVPFGR
jgi:alpha-D-xyloside xylohydrolase